MRLPNRSQFPSIGSKGGIILTSVVQPPSGGIILMYCPRCKQTDILVSAHAVKPERGDVWLIRGVCIDHPEHTFDDQPRRRQPYFAETIL